MRDTATIIREALRNMERDDQQRTQELQRQERDAKDVAERRKEKEFLATPLVFERVEATATVEASPQLGAEVLERTNKGEPSMREGNNPRDNVEKWVDWCARNLKQNGDTTEKLAIRIRLRAERFGYQSARGKFTNTNIIRMLPPGLCGRRGRKPGSQATK